MEKRIRVRRDRPSALSWAIALAATMAAVYLLTLGTTPAMKAENAAASVRVTREVAFEGVDVFFASLGQYPDQWQARVAAAELVSRGAAGAVHAQDGVWHVLGAGYALEADAKRISEKLAGQEGVEAQTLHLSAPAVSLRVTAPEEDAEAVIAADRVLRMQMEQMNRLALQADRGEVSYASARTLARVAASEVRTARKNLEGIAGAEGQPVCAGLIRLLAGLEENLGFVTEGKPSGAELSGRLRLCHADGVLALAEFLRGLNGAAADPGI